MNLTIAKNIAGISLYERGCEYFDARNYSEAVSFFKEAIELSERVYINRINNGFALVAPKENNVSMPLLFDLADAKAKYGESLRRTGCLLQAIKQIDEALELRISPKYFLWGAHTAHQLSDFEVAEHGYFRTLEEGKDYIYSVDDWVTMIMAERMLIYYEALDKTKFSQKAIKKGMLTIEDLNIIENEIQELNRN